MTKIKQVPRSREQWFSIGKPKEANVPNLSQYVDWTETTAIYSRPKFKMAGGMVEKMYAALGMAGEAGEVANLVKKIYRDGLTLQQYGDKLLLELGDVLWYWARLCCEFGINPNAVILANIEKLEDRKKWANYTVKEN